MPIYLTYDDVLLLPGLSGISLDDIDLSANLSKNINLNLPIIASPMDTVCEYEMAIKIGAMGGIGIIHRNQPIKIQVSQIKRAVEKGVMVGAAIGLNDDFCSKAEKIIEAGAKLLCIDHSFGHSKKVYSALRYIKKNYSNIEIISGNIATYDGAMYLFDAGADILRVGKGAGSICVSRKISGVGVPQLTAILETSRAAKKFNKKIIADGGIRSSGDIVKALAAGANAVMLGFLIAGAKESPGAIKKISKLKYKYYRGMGSLQAMKNGSADRYGHTNNFNKLTQEGVEGFVKYEGGVDDIIKILCGGIKSGFINIGAKNIADLQKKAKFIRITPAGRIESSLHSILI